LSNPVCLLCEYPEHSHQSASIGWNRARCMFVTDKTLPNGYRIFEHKCDCPGLIVDNLTFVEYVAKKKGLV
jgi:hypothetical protein